MTDSKNMEPEEEMSVELELDDGTVVNCAVVTVLDVEDKDYIVLLPVNEDGNSEDGEVWFYQLVEDKDDPNKEPELIYIESDEEYEKVAEAFDSYLDDMEYDEIASDED